MERKVFFSVIVPIYNAEKYLSECIESILNQTFQDFELLLIDDGSTDSSSDICKKYEKKDSRVQYLRKENEGVFLARLYGIKNLSGDYFTFCDADDYYANKHAFDELHTILSNKEYSFIQFGFYKKYNHLKYKYKFIENDMECDKESFYANEYPKLLCSFWDKSHILNQTWNKIYNAKLIDNLKSIKENEKIFWGDDQILNMILLSECDNCLFLNQSFYIYRQFSGGTYRFRKESMHDLNTIKKYQMIYLNKMKNISDKTYNSILSIAYSEVAGWFLYFIHQALDNLTEKEVKNLINESLNLPYFIQAREYYLKHKDIQYKTINLLRDADVDKYIKAVYNEKNNISFRTKIKETLKNIFIRI